METSMLGRIRRTGVGPIRGPGAHPGPDREGFSLVELVIALVILTVGILGLAGTTAYVVRQVDISRINSERAAAVQSAVEYVGSISYDAVVPDSMRVDRYLAKWEVIPSRYKTTVRVVTVGPGAAVGEQGNTVIRSDVADTFDYQLIQP